MSTVPVISSTLTLISPPPSSWTGEGETDVLAVRHQSRYAWLSLTSAWSATLYSQPLLSVGRVERRRHQVDFIFGPPLELDDQRGFDSTTFKMDWGSFKKVPDGKTDLFWAYDSWFGQAYGAVFEEGSIEVKSDSKRSTLRFLVDG